MVISIQAVSWPSHYNNMILLGKVIIKLPQVLNNMSKRSIGLKNTCDFIFSAQLFLEHGSNFSPMPTSKQLNLSLLTFCLPHWWFYFFVHMPEQTCALLINIQYTESVAQLGMRYSILITFNHFSDSTIWIYMLL